METERGGERGGEGGTMKREGGETGGETERENTTFGWRVHRVKKKNAQCAY
jgi:hypothetical protein